MLKDLKLEGCYCRSLDCGEESWYVNNPRRATPGLPRALGWLMLIDQS
jgi:hypothetical protein